MKKLCLLLSVILVCSFLCSCKEKEKKSLTDSSFSMKDTIENSTKYSSNNQIQMETPTISKTENINHVHNYLSSIIKNATCGNTGTKKYTCSCGHSYTESIPTTSYHRWEYGNCTAPDTCKVCGITRGVPKSHSFLGGKCCMCGIQDPSVKEATFSLPSLPASYSYYGYSGELYTTAQINSIIYKLNYYYNDELWYTFIFNGTSTYNYQGSGQSSPMRIGYKIYDSNDVVVKSGTIWTENVAVGEKFSEEVVIYDLKPGENYKIVLSDVN